MDTPSPSSWSDLRRLVGEIRDRFAPSDAPEVDWEADLRAERSLELASSDRLRRFQDLGEIGRGGMGAVHRVHDPDLGRDVAMKVLLVRDAEADLHESRGLARFLNEARITSQLDHPGIVSVHEIGRDPGGRPAYTMNLVRGEELGEVIRQSRLGVGYRRARILDVLLRVCETMAYAHSRGVVHRDLKPANVMVGRFGEAYVMDWGLAKRFGEDDESSGPAEAPNQESPVLTQSGQVLGTPAYMAPEQASGGAGEVGPCSDIYSLGAVLYEVLTGCAPYTSPQGGATPHQVLDHLLDGPPRAIEDLAPDTPAALAAICRRAMARRPEDRYPDAEAMARDLRSFLEDRVVSAYRTDLLALASTWIRRNRLGAAGLLLTLLVALAGVITVFVLQERSARQLAHKSDEMEGYSDALRIDELLAESDRLWPRRESLDASFQDFLGRSREVLDRRARHLENHRRLEQDLRQQQLERGAIAAGESVDWDAAETELRWRHLSLRQLDQRMQELDARVEEVRERRSFAAELAALQEEHADLWEEAITEIFLDDRFDGLELSVQPGLIPLGPDPDSGLWEFWHPGSGRRPQRDEDGHLQMLPETGLILVLLPGGRVSIGAQSADPDGVHYDPAARAEEGPVHEVELAPYFLSKFEMTQAQWHRVTGERPSRYGLGSDERPSLHPVEQISWNECMRLMARLGLELPTEVQWEAAARARQPGPWWTGTTASSLAGSCNIADLSYHQLFGREMPREGWDDGQGTHGPVGRYQPNPFGLHDVHGNVWEWCSDGKHPYTVPARDGDGRREPASGIGPLRLLRGGAYQVTATMARAAIRISDEADGRGDPSGLRPALTVR